MLSFLYLLTTLITISYQYKPIIGIYANPEPIDDFTINTGTIIHGPYVRWLESFGAEVLAIHQWYTHEQIDLILSQINGVLFMGGGRSFNVSALWEQNALYIMKASLQKGFPIWGTCMGFQLISVLLSEDESVLKQEYNHMGYLNNLTLTNYAYGSRMYELFNKDDFDAIVNRNGTIYFHTWGVSEEDWNGNAQLTGLFNITSFGHDMNGKKFVNSFEGRNGSVNIYGTQYHPEKNPYVRYDGYEVEHTVDSLRVSHKLGIGFIEQARKVKNRMEYKERGNYDFINTYGKGKEVRYDPEENAYYFKKKESNYISKNVLLYKLIYVYSKKIGFEN